MPPEMAEPSFGDKKISLALKPILESLPVFELSGDPKEVPEDARVELSFSLIQPQLTTGRVTRAAGTFRESAAAGWSPFFQCEKSADAGDAAVAGSAEESA